MAGNFKDEKAIKSSENKATKEVKGVVEIEDFSSCNIDTGKSESMEEINDNTNKIEKAKNEPPKGLPHQQVPQPGDFSSEALENV